MDSYLLVVLPNECDEPTMCFMEESKVPVRVMDAVRSKCASTSDMFTDWFRDFGYDMVTFLKFGDSLTGKVTIAIYDLDD